MKQFIGTMVLLILLIGCAGSPTLIKNTPAVSDTMSLDQALKEAAIQIDTRITPNSKIAALNFNSPHDKFSNYVLDELTADLVDSQILTVVDRKEIDLIRSEVNFDYSGEVADDSAQAAGRMLGAQSIISGSLTDMGGFYRIVVRVLNVQNASVDVQYRANIVNDTIMAALLTGGKAPQVAIAPQSAPAAQMQTAPVTPAPMVQAPATQAVPAVPVTQVPAQASTPPAPGIYNIGDKGPAGGTVFYDKGNNSDGWQYLEAANSDAGNISFGTKQIDGTKEEIGTGQHNTQILVDYMMQNGENFPAAMLCRRYKQGGYNDWFLPSKNELNLMYWNLKQLDLGNLESGVYWSSTIYGFSSAWVQRFSDGNHDFNGEGTVNSVRPIRAF